MTVYLIIMGENNRSTFRVWGGYFWGVENLWKHIITII